MVTIKCKESGIEFEAKTKRTQQHPLIAELKQRANKDGNYRQVNDALTEVRKAGGYETIEEYMSLVDENLKAKTAKADALAIKRREQAQRDEEARERRKQERSEQNRILKANGYIWRKEAIGTEDDWTRGSYGAGIGEFSHHEFRLYAPDGREVTVERALDEINRGADVVKAEEIAKIEEKERAEAEKKAEQAAKQRAYDAVKDEAQALTEVETIDFNTWKQFETIASHRTAMTTYTIKRGQINGITCYVVSQYGDMDYSQFYCESPEKAGLTEKPESNNDFDMSDWF